MKQPLVTVVIPVYNAEKYLDACIESIVGQTYSNLEILMVDDGSPDASPQICDTWALKDSRIRVIHKQNQGAGMARNTGIENATGAYICFVDSDDYIRKDTVETAVRQIAQEQSDLVVYGNFRVNNSGEILSSFIPAVGEHTYRGNAVREEFLPDYVAPDYRKKGPRFSYMGACMASVLSMDLIREHGWRFVSERTIISEDAYSLIDYMQHVRVVSVIPEAFYYYRINESSISRSYRPNRYQNIRHFYQETLALCQNIGYNEDVCHRVSKPYLAFTMGAMKQEAASELPIRQRFQNVKAIVDDPVLQQVLQQNKHDVVTRNRRLLFFCMRHKWYSVIFLLLRLKK